MHAISLCNESGVESDERQFDWQKDEVACGELRLDLKGQTRRQRVTT